MPLPGFMPLMMFDNSGTQQFTMTAGDHPQPGYAKDGSLVYGSISNQPFPPAILRSLFTESKDGTLDMRFFGDQSAALAGYSGLEINGVKKQFAGSWVYDPGLNQTIRRSAINVFNFVAGTSYTCQLVA